MKLLHVDSSILGEASASRALTRDIVAQYRTRHPAIEVTYLDLAQEAPGHLSAASLAGANAVEAARDAALLDSFLAADVVVIGAPLYNFSVPTQLKAWIDRIAVRGKTFRYTANGPEGLAGGKQVIVAVSRGGVYAPQAGTEFAESYLRFLFGFLGVRDVRFVRAEGLNVSPEQRTQSLAQAHAAVAALAAAPAGVALAA